MNVTATEAKVKFGNILLHAQNAPVFIERHGDTVAVVISAGTYYQYQEIKTALEELLAREMMRAKKD